MKKAAPFAAALAGVMLLTALLYQSVASVALRVSEYPAAGLFADMAKELVSYLKGELSGLSALFIEREAQHMRDVKALFDFAKALSVVCLWVGLPLLILGFAFGGRKRAAAGMLAGMGVFALAMAGFGAWAAIDFDGWFTAMHELVFTNDLWLLDPLTSGLIRMLPGSFFQEAVRKVALRFGGGALAMAGAGLVAAYWPYRRKKEH